MSSEPSFRLASLAIGQNLYAQLVAHADPAGTRPEMLDRVRAEARAKVLAAGKEMPGEAHIYVPGHARDGYRFLVGGRANS